MIGSANGRSPVTRCSSEWQSPDAAISTRTSPSLGASSSICSTLHGLPTSHKMAALVFMRGPPSHVVERGHPIERSRRRTHGHFEPVHAGTLVGGGAGATVVGGFVVGGWVAGGAVSAVFAATPLVRTPRLSA